MNFFIFTTRKKQIWYKCFKTPLQIWTGHQTCTSTQKYAQINTVLSTLPKVQLFNHVLFQSSIYLPNPFGMASNPPILSVSLSLQSFMNTILSFIFLCSRVIDGRDLLPCSYCWCRVEGGC